MICPLCSRLRISSYSRDKHREYFVCDDCTLVFVARDSALSAEDERARYDTHQNNPDDPQYREYLSQVLVEMKPFIKDKETALDFGAGRTEVLAILMTAAGLKAEVYDLYYFPREEIWGKKFDVIVLSEVIEHLSDLMGTMRRLTALLNPGGRFFIKTKLLPESKEIFDKWYYKNDPTHLEFFTPKSLDVLSKSLGLDHPIFLKHDVVMVRASR